MENNKNIGIESPEKAAPAEAESKNSATANKEDRAERERYYDEYDDFYYDSTCISCEHWDGSMCDIDSDICGYKSL